jgi:hypothetical protein
MPDETTLTEWVLYQYNSDKSTAFEPSLSRETAAASRAEGFSRYNGCYRSASVGAVIIL